MPLVTNEGQRAEGLVCAEQNEIWVHKKKSNPEDFNVYSKYGWNEGTTPAGVECFTIANGYIHLMPLASLLSLGCNEGQRVVKKINLFYPKP
ncbi:hypothetical protein LH29_01520 [Draconibacterium sediminis]|uniref:Uncharacterized protein n=1 Tax=Draconibacterium sediminis TaxID=1544798 RepID=A0A0D8JBZ0_9BACT|nr:hypothetical protein LH29_01520 [Draconibacterium sediminis]